MSCHRPARGSLAALFLVGCGAASNPPSAGQAEPPRAAAIVAAPVPLRRLTNEEYNNTVRDLLGDESRPADAFPPDEAVGGFENNAVAPVTQLLVERYMAAAEAVAARAVRRLDEFAPCEAAEAPASCAQRFIETFGRLAFRRPLEDWEKSALLGVYAEKEKVSDYPRAIELVLAAMLESPQFLYRIEPARAEGPTTRPLTGEEVATRLSYFVWASTPDAELLDAAEAGGLTAPDDVATAAKRLLRDARAVDGIRSFHRQWLGLRELETSSRDAALYPAFTQELKDAMLEETLRFSAYAVLGGGDAVTALLTSAKSFVNAPLAKLYGVPPPAGGGFALVDLPRGERSGLLTHAGVMTVLASAEQASPILRGKFVREKLLCQPIPPPPPGVMNAPPPPDPHLTSRERFAQHRKDPSCAACHQMMEPIGFGFEHYDSVGAWRAVDGDFPVDAVGALSGTEDVDGPFDGAPELGARLAASEQVRRCIATQWFRAAIGRSERDEDEVSLDEVYRAFAAAGFDVRELIVAVAKSDAFRYGSAEGGHVP